MAKKIEVEVEEPHMGHAMSDIKEGVTVGSDKDHGNGKESCSVSAAATTKQNIEGLKLNHIGLSKTS